jgi:hypothetical protein
MVAVVTHRGIGRAARLPVLVSILLFVPATAASAKHDSANRVHSTTARGWPVYTIVNRGGRVSIAGGIQPPRGGRWVVDDVRGHAFGYAFVSSNGRWQVYEYSIASSSFRVGFASRTSANHWNVYDPTVTLNGVAQQVGYVVRAAGGRWDLFAGYGKVGFVSGVPPGVAAAADSLLFIPH